MQRYGTQVKGEVPKNRGEHGRGLNWLGYALASLWVYSAK